MVRAALVGQPCGSDSVTWIWTLNTGSQLGVCKDPVAGEQLFGAASDSAGSVAGSSLSES